MNKKWAAILLIVECFIVGSMLPVYATENTASESEQLTTKEIVQEKQTKEFSKMLLTEATESKALAVVKEANALKEQAKVKEAEEQRLAKEKTETAAKEKAEADKLAAEQEQAAKQATAVPATTTQPAGKTMLMEATAYSCNEGDIGGGYVTALGQDLRANPKAVAVDPTVIPLGSRVYVEGYGEAIAGDTGGAIKGNIIDVHFADPGVLADWGRRQVQVTILE